MTKQKISALLVDRAIDYLFEGQKLPTGFRRKFQNYVSEQFEELNCCTLYIAKNVELTQKFRDFMGSFPTLDCGKRQVIIFETGTIAFRSDYRNNHITKSIRMPSINW